MSFFDFHIEYFKFQKPVIESPRSVNEQRGEVSTPAAAKPLVAVVVESDKEMVRPETKVAPPLQQVATASKKEKEEEPINANKQNSGVPRKPSASEPRTSAIKKEGSKAAGIRDSDADSFLSKTIKAPEAPKPPQIQSLSSTAPAGFSSAVKSKGLDNTESQSVAHSVSSPGENVIDWDTMDLPLNWERRQDLKTNKVFEILCLFCHSNSTI